MQESKHKYNDPIVPVEQRDCTDLVCLIIYLSLVFIILVIGIYAWAAAYDPDGKGCGVDYPNYPYIYFASPHTDSLWVTVCVQKCPKSGDTVLVCQPNSVVTTCTQKKSSDNTKSVEVYDSSLTANTACLPTSDTVKNKIGDAFGTSGAAMNSLLNNYSLVLIAIPIAIAIAIIFMLLIKWCAKFFMYIMIVLVLLALVGFGLWLLLAPTSTGTGSNTGSAGSIIAAVVCFLLAILIIVLLCCFRKRIALAASIVKVAANFVSGNLGVVVLPLLLFVITLLFLTLWVFQALGFYALGPPVTVQHQYPFQHFKITGWIKLLFAFHVIYLVWTLMFLIQTSSFIVGGAATNWYYKHEQPYGQAAQRYRKKHMGSVIFGAIMLALLGLVRLIYQTLVPQANAEGQTSCITRCCNCCCCCCASIFEWFSSGAFTIINIRGSKFCPSGQQAFTLKLLNFATSSIVSIVQTLFTLLVRLGITFLTMLFIYIIIKSASRYRESVQDSTLILIVVGFVAFTIGCFFISVYSDAIEAIYMTYLVDKERGDAGDNCPQELKEFFQDTQNNNKEIEAQAQLEAQAKLQSQQVVVNEQAPVYPMDQPSSARQELNQSS